jgi:hypothetical protein
MEPGLSAFKAGIAILSTLLGKGAFFVTRSLTLLAPLLSSLPRSAEFFLFKNPAVALN